MVEFYGGDLTGVSERLDHLRVNQHAEPRRVGSNAVWPTEAFSMTWQASRAAIPWAIPRQEFNLLGSHDPPRIPSVVNADPARNRLAIASGQLPLPAGVQVWQSIGP